MKHVYIFAVLSVLCLGFVFYDHENIKENKLIEIAYNFINYPYKEKPIKCDLQERTPGLSEIKNFDCVTFIETVLALYQSQHGLFNSDFQKNLQKMRYKNSVNNCKNRNHFFVLDWIQNNPVFNFTNITKNIASNQNINFKNVVIDKSKWFRQNYNMDIKTRKEYLTIDYITFDNFINTDFNNLKNILPKISLMVIVGTNKNIDINHVGFLIKFKSKIVLLHASYRYKKIIEENIFSYLSNIKKNKTMLGIAVFQISHKNNLHY